MFWARTWMKIQSVQPSLLPVHNWASRSLTSLAAHTHCCKDKSSNNPFASKIINAIHVSHKLYCSGTVDAIVWPCREFHRMPLRIDPVSRTARAQGRTNKHFACDIRPSGRLRKLRSSRSHRWKLCIPHTRVIPKAFVSRGAARARMSANLTTSSFSLC